MRLLYFNSRKVRALLPIAFASAVLLINGCGGLVSHKVESGDSLYSIGFYYGQDYRDIAKWNNISAPYIIHKGQWLRVAPPNNNWRDERKQQQKQQVSLKAPVNKPVQSRPVIKRGTKVVNKAANKTVNKTTKKVVVEDFTDKSGSINAWVWPAKGRLLNADSKFSRSASRSPSRNKGIDIAGKRGQPIYATAAGKVVYSGSGLIGYGKLIIVKHNKIYLSAYAHNEKILVKEGDIVKGGQVIARMGRTPDHHVQLHFEIRRYGKPVDPLRYLKR